MTVNKIVLQNFRNFDLKQINPTKLNIISGKNASGKTNILEGIYTIINGHSFKKSNIVIKKRNTKKTYLHGIIDNDKVEIIIENNVKTIKINDKKSNIMKLKESFASILYSIDSFLSFKNKEYLFSLIDRNGYIENKNIINELMEYKKLIKIKKKILLSDKQPDEKLLQITNRKIFELIYNIKRERERSIEYINNNINSILNSFIDKTVEIKYKQEQQLKDITQKEIYERKILTSINRDKVEIMYNGINLFHYSSVGEKKIILFCLIICIIKHYNKYTEPILLIDDLEGDLDINFKHTAFDILLELPNQLFLTTLGEYLYNNANIIRL